MPIDLGVFSDRYLDFVKACGCIQPSENVATLAPNQPQSSLTGEYERNGRVWLHLVTNQHLTPAGIHFHLDCARNPNHFNQATQPVDINNLCLEQKLAQFAGQQANFNVTCGFYIDRLELRRESVINLLLNVTVGPPETGAQLTASTYQFNSGAEVDLQWSLGERDGCQAIFTTIRSERSLCISSQLLNDLVSPAITTFHNLVLEEGVDST